MGGRTGVCVCVCVCECVCGDGSVQGASHHASVRASVCARVKQADARARLVIGPCACVRACV